MKSFRKAAVASTFSPTHLAVLVEAAAFARKVGAELEVLHASPRTEEKAKHFEESFEVLGMDLAVHWLEGNNPGEVLLQAVREGGHDVLIAGALECEPGAEARAFTGSVARRFLTESPCDLLLLPRPTDQSPIIGNAFFAVEPGQRIGAFALEAASILRLKAVTLAVAQTPFAAAIAASKGEAIKDPAEWADEITELIENAGIEVETLHIDSNTGFGLCDAVQGFGADLLIVKASRQDSKIRLPAHMDWLRQVIPTRLLVCCED